MTRRQEQVLSALSLVRAERTDIGEEALQRVHRRAEHLRRSLHDGRTIAFQIKEAHPVYRLGVCGKHERLGVHERLPDDDLVGSLGSEVAKAAPRFDDGDGRHLGEIDLDGPIELELVQQGVGRLGCRVAVLEPEISKTGLDRFRANPAVPIGFGISSRSVHRFPVQAFASRVPIAVSSEKH